MAEPGLTEIATTTARRRTKKIMDNTMNNNPITFKMKASGNVTMGVSGDPLIEEVDYAENQSFKRYEDDEQLNTIKSPVLTSFSYDPKQSAVAIVMTGLEELKNSGSEAKINLLKARMKNAERTIKNITEGDVKSDGTASGGKQIGGLELLIAEDPTAGSVGGITRSTNAFAQNISYGVVAQTGSALAVTNIERILRDQLLTPTTRAGDRNRLLVFGDTYWGLISDAMSSRQRFVDKELADMGFENFKFYGVPCVLGGGFQFTGTSATAMDADKVYLLNLDYLHLRIYGDRFFSPLSKRESINQDAMIQYLVFAGNMTCSNFQLQGVVYDS